MSARTLAAALLQYLDERACPDVDWPNRLRATRGSAELKTTREEILDQLHSNPQLADEPLFVNAREYLLDEACGEASDPNECDPNSVRRLEALRTHLRKEARTFLAVDGVRKTERGQEGLTTRWAKIPPEIINGPRILIAVDGSQQSSWAVRCGERMARRLSASLLLVHVTPLPPPVSDGVGTIELSDVATTKQIFAHAHRLLPPEPEVNEIVRQGGAAEEILRTAQDWRADLIVMGTHGRGRIARFLLGSVAEAVIRRATCPVMTIAHEPSPQMWQADDPAAAEHDLANACA